MEMSLDDLIVQLVSRLQRYSQGRGVFAYMIQAQLDIYRAEGTLRKDMVRLWHEGRLERLGGEGCRRGYRVPHQPVVQPIADTYERALKTGAEAWVVKQLGDLEATEAGRRAAEAARSFYRQRTA